MKKFENVFTFHNWYTFTVMEGYIEIFDAKANKLYNILPKHDIKLTCWVGYKYDLVVREFDETLFICFSDPIFDKSITLKCDMSHTPLLSLRTHFETLLRIINFTILPNGFYYGFEPQNVVDKNIKKLQKNEKIKPN